MMIRDKAIQRFAWFFALLLLLFLFATGKGLAERPVADDSLVRTSDVRIDYKTSGTIMVKERHFQVTSATMILDEKGDALPFSLLMVPCEAELQYQLRMDQDPECLKIVVKRLVTRSEIFRTTSSLER